MDRDARWYMLNDRWYVVTQRRVPQGEFVRVTRRDGQHANVRVGGATKLHRHQYLYPVLSPLTIGAGLRRRRNRRIAAIGSGR